MSHPGKPMGTDTVPAWLTPGEFIMNAEATRMFGPIIEQMNNAGRVQQMAQGGTIPEPSSGEQPPVYKDRGGFIDAMLSNIQLPQQPQVDPMAVENAALEAQSYQPPAPTAVPADRSEFMSRLKAAALKEQERTGVDHRIIMAQAIQETGWGESVKGNNYFGIKAHGSDDPNNITMTTHEVIDGQRVKMDDTFRGYKSLEDSVKGYGDFILANPRYGDMISAQGLDAQIAALGASGYATDPNYANAIKGIIGGKTFAQYKAGGGHVDALRKQYNEMNTVEEGLEYDPRGANQIPTPQYVPEPVGPTIDHTPSVLEAVTGMDIPTVRDMMGKNTGRNQPIPNPASPHTMNVAAAHMMNRADFESPALPTVPSIDGTADEDEITKTLNRAQWNTLKSKRDSYPEGSPERKIYNDAMNSINIATTTPEAAKAIVGEAATDVMSLNDELDPRRGNEASGYKEVPVPEDFVPNPYKDLDFKSYPVGHPLRIYGIAEGLFEATDADRDWEEAAYKTNEALKQNELQLAVTAPDNPNKEFFEQRQIALQDQMTALGVPEIAQGHMIEGGINLPSDNPVNMPAPSMAQVSSVEAPRVGMDTDDVGAVPGLDVKPSEVIEKGPEAVTEAPKQPEANNAATVKANLPQVTEEEQTQVASANTVAVEEAGKKAAYADGTAFKGARDAIKSAFGDLFDSKELARAAIMYLGARATGMSGNAALAFAGRGYISRVDAKESMYNNAAASGKYTKESLAEFKKTKDPAVLMAVGEKPVYTGKFSTRYTKNGKKIDVQEVKVGDSIVFMDTNGNVVSGFATMGTSPEERRKSVKAMATQTEAIVSGLKEQFGAIRGEGGKSTGDYRTQVVPEVAGYKVAELFIDEGVSPEDAGSVIEAAYHDMLNDNVKGRQKRDLVPYIRQNIIRNKVGSHLNTFVVTPAEDGKPAEYVDPAKLTELNTMAANWLAGKGHAGNTTNLAGQFYTAALSDWNDLTEEERAMYEKKSGKHTNGFYEYALNWLITNK